MLTNKNSGILAPRDTRIAVNQPKPVLFPTDSWCFKAGIRDSVGFREPYAAPLRAHDHLIFHLRPSPTRTLYHSPPAPHPQVFGLLKASIASQSTISLVLRNARPFPNPAKVFSADLRCLKSRPVETARLIGRLKTNSSG